MSLRSVRVREETYKLLVKLKGKIEYETGKILSIDDLIRSLAKGALNEHKEEKEDVVQTTESRTNNIPRVHREVEEVKV